MKVVERVLEKRLHRIVTVNELLFRFMPERGIIDAVFILRRLQEEYHAKEKGHICFVDIERAIDRVPRKMLEWAMRKKGIPSFVKIGDEYVRAQRQESEWILSHQKMLRLKREGNKDLCSRLFSLQLQKILSLNWTERVCYDSYCVMMTYSW